MSSLQVRILPEPFEKRDTTMVRKCKWCGRVGKVSAWEQQAVGGKFFSCCVRCAERKLKLRNGPFGFMLSMRMKKEVTGETK